MAPPTALVVWQTVQAVIEQAAGVTTIWRDQNADQPAGDYIDMAFGSYLTDGIDYIITNDVADWEPATAYALGARVVNDGGRTYTCTTAGTSAASPATGPSGTGTGIADGSCVWTFTAAGGEISQALAGTREVVLSLQAWSAAVVEQLAKVTALALLDRVVGLLRMPLARDQLGAIGFVPFDPGAVNWLPSIVAIGFRGRATCDIRCRVPAYALEQFTSYIASISMGAQVEQDSGPTITLPIEAP